MNKELIENVLSWIDSTFNQDYYPELYKPYKILDCVVFFWDCGGIILHDTMMQTFCEDDGNWFLPDPNYKLGINMSSAWLPQFIKCLKAANKYLKDNGVPYYYSGTNTICGYKLQ